MRPGYPQDGGKKNDSNINGRRQSIPIRSQHRILFDYSSAARMVAILPGQSAEDQVRLRSWMALVQHSRFHRDRVLQRSRWCVRWKGWPELLPRGRASCLCHFRNVQHIRNTLLRTQAQKGELQVQRGRSARGSEDRGNRSACHVYHCNRHSRNARACYHEGVEEG